MPILSRHPEMHVAYSCSDSLHLVALTQTDPHIAPNETCIRQGEDWTESQELRHLLEDVVMENSTLNSLEGYLLRRGLEEVEHLRLF